MAFADASTIFDISVPGAKSSPPPARRLVATRRVDVDRVARVETSRGATARVLARARIALVRTRTRQSLALARANGVSRDVRDARARPRARERRRTKTNAFTASSSSSFARVERARRRGGDALSHVRCIRVGIEPRAASRAVRAGRAGR